MWEVHIARAVQRLRELRFIGTLLLLALFIIYVSIYSALGTQTKASPGTIDSMLSLSVSKSSPRRRPPPGRNWTRPLTFRLLPPLKHVLRPRCHRSKAGMLCLLLLIRSLTDKYANFWRWHGIEQVMGPPVSLSVFSQRRLVSGESMESQGTVHRRDYLS